MTQVSHTPPTDGNAPLPLGLFKAWLATGERGISSETIVGHLTDTPIPHRDSHPYDPADLRRCELLLRAVPLARPAFADRMSLASPEWAALIPEWDSLVACMEDEVPGCFNGAAGKAPETYRRMKELTAPP